MHYTWKKGEVRNLNKYFKNTEFENTTDSEFFINCDLIEKLEKLREEFGSPIKITSGYRSQEHNKKVGGHPNSTHTKGDAVDISPIVFTEVNLDKLYELCEKYFKAVGDGRARGFCHVDMRDDKVRRWIY